MAKGCLRTNEHSGDHMKLETVDYVDIKRFMGDWYVIANIPTKGFIKNKETNAEWRMQFIWPFKMPFLIVDLDENYLYTVIGIPSKKYVWIMARNPVLDDDTYNGIIDRLSKSGYNTSLVQKLVQDWD